MNGRKGGEMRGRGRGERDERKEKRGEERLR